MGIGVGIFLVAVGAILAFAVHVTGGGFVNVQMIGWILIAAGGFGILLSLVFWSSWGGPGYLSRRDAAVRPGPTDPPAAW